jgi:nucleotide-binding universal stress UspA family protein
MQDPQLTPAEQPHVIVGVDDSAAGLAALRCAVSQARSRGAELVAVRAWALGLPRHGGRRCRGNGRGHLVLRFNGSQQRAAAVGLAMRAFDAAGGLPCDIAVRIETPEGDPASALTGLARRDGDLLVVGTGPAHLVKRVVHGSVSRYCARRSRCQVLVVSPADRAASAMRADAGPGSAG